VVALVEDGVVVPAVFLLGVLLLLELALPSLLALPVLKHPAWSAKGPHQYVLQTLLVGELSKP
jgi:hypothetical protein